jgi:hypothetical protein
LGKIADKLAHKGATSEEIVAEFLKKHRATLDEELQDVLHVALIRLANRVCSRRPGKLTDAQIEMFKEYGACSKIMVLATDGQRKYKNVDSATLAEANEYVSWRTKPRTKHSKKIDELHRMVHDFEEAGYPETAVIGECWAELRKGS